MLRLIFLAVIYYVIYKYTGVEPVIPMIIIGFSLSLFVFFDIIKSCVEEYRKKTLKKQKTNEQ